MKDFKINHKATWTAIVIILVILYVWYNYIFYDTWLSINNLTAEYLKENLDPVPYIISFFSVLLTVYVLDIIFTQLEIKGFGMGITVAMAFGFAFSFLNVVAQDLHAFRPIEISFVDGGANMITFAIAGGIIGGWNKSNSKDSED